MGLKNLTKVSKWASVLLVLAGCGGGGTVQQPGSQPVLAGFQDNSRTTPIDIVVVGRNGVAAGTYDVRTRSYTSLGATTSELGPRMQGVYYTTFGKDGTVAVIETTGPITPATATYTGRVYARVTDVRNNWVFDGFGNASVKVDFTSPGASTIDYRYIRGTRTSPTGNTSTFANGAVSIAGSTATANGLTGGSVVSTSNFGATGFTGATTTVSAKFGGPDAIEIGGIADATGPFGVLQSSFVAKR